MNARRYPVRHSRDSRNVPLDFEAGQLHEQYELLGSGSRRTTPQPPTPIEELNQLADAHDRAGRNDWVIRVTGAVPTARGFSSQARGRAALARASREHH